MNKQTMLISAALVTAAAGSAFGDFNYAFDTAVSNVFSYGFNAATGEFPFDESNLPALNATNQTINFNHNIDVSTNPYINSITNAGTFTGQAAPDRFAVTWLRDSAASVQPGTTSAQAEANASMNVEYKGTITFTTDAMINISFGLLGNDFATGIDQDAPARLTVTTSLSTFTYNAVPGFPSNAPNPFEFPLAVSAGQTLSFHLIMASSQSSTTYLTDQHGWNNHQEGYFIIEQIPAPSAATLLALGGLVAARRRRGGC